MVPGRSPPVWRPSIGKFRRFEAIAVTITRIGTNQKYADGWDKAFGGKRGSSAAAKPAQKKAAPSKKAAPKKTKKGKK